MTDDKYENRREFIVWLRSMADELESELNRRIKHDKMKLLEAKLQKKLPTSMMGDSSQDEPKETSERDASA